MRCVLACCLLMGGATVVCGQVPEAPPRVLDDRLKLELFAEQPQLVTPTGIDIDARGRVWVIESNTHFPPDGYKGHSTDRVLVMEDTDGDHKADRVTPFLDGLTHTMSVAVQPEWLRAESVKRTAKSQKSDSSSTLDAQPSTLFIATRRQIILAADIDGDLRCDTQTPLVTLETEGNYPHNGLGGFAFDALGWMYFGFGENLGADYRILGSDGTTLSGGGEGGNIYQCRPDGSKLEQWATGFWNPHASCFDAFGRLFTVDNDPDSRPPCRLLHIIQGGDYGYRFRNGRKGTHPFTSWNGEIPGTLPMVAGTGEAPSGIVCYESDGFPEDYQGTLLVGSWGDHRIDLFRLKPKGASFTSQLEPVVVGGENFRPVGLAIAPDGSLYFTDWVLQDYKLHGRGRVWRLSAKEEVGRARPSTEDFSKLSNDALVTITEGRRLDDRRNAAEILYSRFATLNARVEDVSKGELSDAEAAECEMLAHVFDLGRIERWGASSPRRGTPRSRFELLMSAARHSVAHGNAWSPFPVGEKLGGKLKTDAVDTATLQLSDPLVGIDRADELDSDVDDYIRWTSQFESDRPDFEDGLIWLYLARRETWLLELLAGYTCASGREAYFEHVPAYLAAPDPFVFAALVGAVAREGDLAFRTAARVWEDSPNRLPEGLRLIAVLAARQRPKPPQEILRLALRDPSPRVRFAAVQWIGEEKLVGFRGQVEEALSAEPMTRELLLACLATLQLLDGKPASDFEKTPPTKYMLDIVGDVSRSPVSRAQALAMLPAGTPELTDTLLTEFLQSPDPGQKREAVRLLQLAPRGTLLPELLRIAADTDATVSLRADAVSGLCGVPHEQPLPPDIESLLIQYAQGKVPAAAATANELRTIQEEALRGLRGRATASSKIGAALTHLREQPTAELTESLDLALGRPTNAPTLQDVLPEAGDAERGRRVFFHHNGPLCARCHAVEGRGGSVGPDLSVIARTMDRRKLAQSIFEPSREISPQFVTWVVVTTEGKTVNGVIVKESGNGDLEIGDARGEVTLVKGSEIEERLPAKVSVMPEGLHKQMTLQEFRDLLAYLETLK